MSSAGAAEEGYAVTLRQFRDGQTYISVSDLVGWLRWTDLPKTADLIEEMIGKVLIHGRSK